MLAALWVLFGSAAFVRRSRFLRIQLDPCLFESLRKPGEGDKEQRGLATGMQSEVNVTSRRFVRDMKG